MVRRNKYRKNFGKESGEGERKTMDGAIEESIVKEIWGKDIFL